MVEVEKYVRKLLYEQDCVIIPGFGGLLTHYTAARYDAATGNYLPSRKKVAFNEVLKMDDGLLSQYISVNEGFSREHAHQCIHDFVLTAMSLIRKNKVITLNGIGSFRLNEESRLVFEPLHSRNFHTGFYGLDEVRAQALNHQLVPVVEEVEEEPDTDVLVTEAPLQAGRQKSGWLSWAGAAVIAGLVVYVSAVLSQEPGMVDTSSMNPLAGVSQLFTSEKAVDKPVLPEVTREAAVSVEEADAPAEEIPVSAEETVTEATVSHNTAFFVVASVYESRNALLKYGDDVENVLKAQGFENIGVLEVKDRYMITAGAYESWSEASSQLPRLRNVAKGAWIYKKRAGNR